MDYVELENPSRRWLIIPMALFTAIPFGFIVVFPSVAMAVIALALAGYIDFMFWLREWYLRPNHIRIGEDGLVLFFRYGKPRLVEWSDVRDVSVHKGDPSTMRGRTESGGELILVRNQRPPRVFPVTLEAAEEIRKRQSERFANPLSVS